MCTILVAQTVRRYSSKFVWVLFTQQRKAAKRQQHSSLHGSWLLYCLLLQPPLMLSPICLHRICTHQVATAASRHGELHDSTYRADHAQAGLEQLVLRLQPLQLMLGLRCLGLGSGHLQALLHTGTVSAPQSADSAWYGCC